jgi:excisionase family DNA binding protein
MPATASNLATTVPTPSAGLPRQSSESAAAGLFMSTLDAARVLCMSDRSVRNLVARGHLHAFRPCIGGRKFLLYSSEVMAYARTAQKPAHDAAMANVQRLRALIG